MEFTSVNKEQSFVVPVWRPFCWEIGKVRGEGFILITSDYGDRGFCNDGINRNKIKPNYL